MRIKCLLPVFMAIIAFFVYFPARHARHYDYIKEDDVYDSLEFTTRNLLPDNRNNLKNCNYFEVILRNSVIEIEEIYKKKTYKQVVKGGEYKPNYCNPSLKIALIVPYRNRTEHLQLFVNYMHEFLQKQHLWYRIFIVEQNDNQSFNRAKMLNFGAKIAKDSQYSCLILHDVDLIPITTGNIYACHGKPRHMSSSLDSFRFNLPYLTLFGGAVAIQFDHFQRVNGMSNLFYGWGGEDDDFYKRLEAHDLSPIRLAPSLSTYTMLRHRKEKPNQNRFKKLKYSLERHRVDGISSLDGNYTIVLEDLYTLIKVF